jgi:hypothetical protein
MNTLALGFIYAFGQGVEQDFKKVIYGFLLHQHLEMMILNVIETNLQKAYP